MRTWFTVLLLCLLSYFYLKLKFLQKVSFVVFYWTLVVCKSLSTSWWIYEIFFLMFWTTLVFLFRRSRILLSLPDFIIYLFLLVSTVLTVKRALCFNHSVVFLLTGRHFISIMSVGCITNCFKLFHYRTLKIILWEWKRSSITSKSTRISQK